jgi:pimeloyl-ACP methyl ester carboxylesterase
MAYRRDNSADGHLSQLSPDYSDHEIGHIWDGNKFATPYLLPEVVALDLTKANKLAVPLILFLGRHDRNVNAEVAAAWFDAVKAPEKQRVWFEHSAHIPMTEEPGKFLLSLAGVYWELRKMNRKFIISHGVAPAMLYYQRPLLRRNPCERQYFCLSLPQREQPGW